MLPFDDEPHWGFLEDIDVDMMLDGEPPNYHKKTVTCFLCKETGLHWEEHGSQWKLYKGNKQHICNDPENLDKRLKGLTCNSGEDE